jgi:hypothetical protein
MEGKASPFKIRRRSASKELRYFVGFAPKELNTRRQATTAGISAIGVDCNAARTSNSANRILAVSAIGEGSLETSSIKMHAQDN